jgi:hypothetical protein
VTCRSSMDGESGMAKGLLSYIRRSSPLPPHWRERTKMAKTTKRSKRREWSKGNVRELKAHSRSKTPVAEISKLMKRTEGALRQKAFQIGLSLGHQR